MGPIVQTFVQLGIPLGAIPVGVGIGLSVYGAILYLGSRPSTEGAGTVPVRVVPASSAGSSSGTPEGAPPRKVRVFAKRESRTVWMQGAGEHPSVPLPRARGFLAALLGLFVGFSTVILLEYGRLFASYDHLVALVGSFLYWPLAWPGVYSVSARTLVVPDYIFPMYLAAMGAFCLASGLALGTRFGRRRRVFALATVAAYVGLEVVLDALFFTVPGSTLRNFALIVRALTGGLFMALLSFCVLYLPHPQRLTPRFPRDRAALRDFLGLGGVAVLVSMGSLLAVSAAFRLVSVLFTFTLLLIFPLLTLLTFAALARALYFRQVRANPLPALSEYHPSVSIVMPAYNEEEWVEGAVLAADRAAAHYPGPVQIIVGNDGSTDRTLEFARRAIGQVRFAHGYVVDLPHGGKSNALNGALAVATGEIVLRCDADTYISETPGFASMIGHFADPQVGGVQGGIHPRQRDGWTRKLRALEIAWVHYFLRPAGMGTRSAEVIDGLFSAFRRKDLVDLGGWVPWNGEDTEISIRLQRLGYRIRIELGALAYEDVPADYDALRRQRVRWGRGILMANGQHYPALFGPTPEFAGLGILFWFLLLVRSGVRSLVYVFLGLLVVLLGIPGLVDTLVLLAIAIGLRAAPLAYFLVRMRRFDVLPWIPFFPFASILKQSFRFEAIGTLGPTAAREYI